MAVKVNDQVIPSWAIERQAQALFEQVARGMPGKPREVVHLAAMDLAKERNDRPVANGTGKQSSQISD